MKQLLVVLFFTFGVLTIHAQDTYTVEGIVDTSFNNKYIHLYGLDYSGMNQKIDDSTQVKNGRFAFTGKINTPGMLTSMYINEEGGKFPSAFTQFYIQPGKIAAHLTGKRWKEENVKLTGAQINKQYTAWKESTAKLPNQYQLQYIMDSLKRVYPDSSFTNMKNRIDSINKAEKVLKIQYIKEHPDEYFSLQALAYFLFADVSKTPDIMTTLYNSLSSELRELPEGKKLKERMIALSDIKPGKEAPVFTIPDAAGKMVSLSDFKGNYVLIDFWASWCGPCIELMPQLKKFVEKNKSRGMKVISVSLDENKEAWLQAVKKHQLNWTNVSELKGWNGQVSVQYNIQYIPLAILVDPEGKIAAVDVDFSKNYF